MVDWDSLLSGTADPYLVSGACGNGRGITNGMYGYGNDFSSYIEQLFEEAGLGYSYGYRASSSLTQSMIRPLADWIQKTLGLSTNPLILIAAVAMPILEIIILVQIRAAENRR